MNYQNTGTFRITRLAYLIRWIFILIGAIIASRLMDTSSHVPLAAKIVLTTSGVALVLFLLVGLFRWVLIPRLHDMGLEPAWAWSLLFFINSLNFLFLLALLFVPTDAFSKRSYLLK